VSAVNEKYMSNQYNIDDKNNLDPDKVQEDLIRKNNEAKSKKYKMKVCGKSIFDTQKMIKRRPHEKNI
jgi:hypothetical protein